MERKINNDKHENCNNSKIEFDNIIKQLIKELSNKHLVKFESSNNNEYHKIIINTNHICEKSKVIIDKYLIDYYIYYDIDNYNFEFIFKEVKQQKKSKGNKNM